MDYRDKIKFYNIVINVKLLSYERPFYHQSLKLTAYSSLKFIFHQRQTGNQSGSVVVGIKYFQVG
jgi:hypothetical protein